MKVDDISNGIGEGGLAFSTPGEMQLGRSSEDAPDKQTNNPQEEFEFH